MGYGDKYTSGMYSGFHAIRWDASGTDATELGNLGTDGSGYTENRAVAINSAGMAVGYGTKYEAGSDKGERVIRWDASGTDATELGNLGTDGSGYTKSQAFDINFHGTAVGFAYLYSDSGTLLGTRAVMWGLDGVAIDLNSLIDPATGWTLTAAYDISDTNWITGQGLFSPDGAGGQGAYYRAFLMHVPVQAPEPGVLTILALAIPAFSRLRLSRVCS